MERFTWCMLAIAAAIVSLVFTFVGLPWNYDTEPILAFGIICVAAGMLKRK